MQPFHANLPTAADQQPAAPYYSMRTAPAASNGGPIQDPYHGQSPHARGGRTDFPPPPPIPPPPPYPPNHHASVPPVYNTSKHRQGSLKQVAPQDSHPVPPYSAQQGNWNRASGAGSQPFRQSPPTGTNYPPPPPHPSGRSQTLNPPTHAAATRNALLSHQHQGYPQAYTGPPAPHRQSTLQHQPSPYNSEIAGNTNPYYNSDASPQGVPTQFLSPKPPLPQRSKSKYVPEYAQPGQVPSTSEYAVSSPIDVAGGPGRHAHRAGSNSSTSNTSHNYWHHPSQSHSSGSNGANSAKPPPSFGNPSASQQSSYSRHGSIPIPSASSNTNSASPNSLPYPETSNFPNPVAWRVQEHDGWPSSSPEQRRQSLGAPSFGSSSFGSPSFGSSGMSPNFPRRRKSLSNSNRPVSPLLVSPTPSSLNKGLARGSSVSSVSSEKSHRTSLVANEGRASASALGGGAPSDWEYYAPATSTDDVDDNAPVELPANDYSAKIQSTGGSKDGVMHELPAEPITTGPSQGHESLAPSQVTQPANPKAKAQEPGMMEPKQNSTDKNNQLGSSAKPAADEESSKLALGIGWSSKPTPLAAARDEASRSPRPKQPLSSFKPASAPKPRAKDVIPELDDWYQDSLDNFIQALRDESFAPDGPEKRKAFIDFVMYEAELRNLPIPWEETLRFYDGSEVGHTETRAHENEVVKNSFYGQRGPKTNLEIPTTPIERIDEDDEEYSPGGRPIIPRPPFGANRPSEPSKPTGNNNDNSAANSETSSQAPIATPTSSKFDESSTVAPSPLKYKAYEPHAPESSNQPPLCAFVTSPESRDEAPSMFPMPLAPRPKSSTPGPSSKPSSPSPAVEAAMLRLESLMEDLPVTQNAGEHPLLHHVNSTLSAIPESEPFLRSIRLAFGSQEREKREQIEAERQKRQDQASRLNDELFDDNEITFSQLKERERNEKETEAARAKAEEHELYEEYATQVFDKSYARLHEDIGVAMRLLEELDAAATAAEQRLKKDSSAAETSSSSTSADSYTANPPTLSTCAKILHSIHAFLAARQALVVAAVSARDARYARAAFAPATAAGDQAKLKSLESHFGHAQAEASVRASKEAFELAKGIEKRCGAWTDLCRTKGEEWMSAVASALEELAREKGSCGEIESKVLQNITKGIEAWTQELVMLIRKSGEVTREVRRKEGVMKMDKAAVDGLTREEKTVLEEQAKQGVDAVESEVEQQVEDAIRFGGVRERVVKALDSVGAGDHIKRANSVLAEPRSWIGK